MVTFDQNSLTNGNGAAIYNEGVIASDDQSNRAVIEVHKNVLTIDDVVKYTYYDAADKAEMEEAIRLGKKISYKYVDGTTEAVADATALNARKAQIAADSSFVTTVPLAWTDTSNLWMPTQGGIKDSEFSNNNVRSNVEVWGGTIHNTLSGIISNIDGVFNNNTLNGENNTTITKGGVIANLGVIGSINGIYENNSVYGIQINGGVLFNNGVIDTIDGLFKNNSLIGYTSTDPSFDGGNTWHAGGALSLKGNVKNVLGTYIGNYTQAYQRAATGGALSIEDVEIENVDANFIGNYVINSGVSYAQGGAVWIQNTGKKTIDNIAGKFSENYTQANSGAAEGGGIYIALENQITNLDAQFTGNYAKSTSGTAQGGGIYNAGEITNLYGDFEGNYVESGDESTSTAGGAVSGGAIYNTGTIGQIGSANNYSSFKGNYAKSYGNSSNGGAIYNIGTVGDIYANFENNKVDGQSSSAGSSIYNSGTINSIKGVFSGNSDTTNASVASDTNGTLFNIGQINSITGGFSNNTATLYGANAATVGGTGLTNFGKIGTIDAYFRNNTATSTNNVRSAGLYNADKIEAIKGEFVGNSSTAGAEAGYAQGGALFNRGTIGYISADFIKNSTNATVGTSAGSAIFNDGTIDLVKGDFINNVATSGATAAYNASGGAIYNTGTMKVVGDFIGNKAINTENNIYNNDGGAIFNTGTITLTGNFINNSTGAAGGAILNRGTVNLIADTGHDINFYNNVSTASHASLPYFDVANRGTFNLNAAEGQSITFNGGIFSGSGITTKVLNINNGTEDIGGEYAFNNEVRDQQVNLYNNAQVKLGSVKQQDGTTTYGSLNLTSLTNDANGGFIDSRNYSAGGAFSLGEVTLNSDLHMAIDANTNGYIDQIAATSVSNSSNTYKFVIDAINLTGLGSSTSLSLGTSVTKDAITLATSINNYDQEKHIYHILGPDNHIYTANYNASDGRITFADTGVLAKNLAYYVANGDGVSEATYKLYQDEQVMSDLGGMQGNGYTLNIDGQGNTIHGNGKSGIIVNAGQNFNADNVTFDGFSRNNSVNERNWATTLVNYGNITNLNADFTNNVAVPPTARLQMGGAIINVGTIDEINGNYLYNGIVRSDGGLAAGGAIVNGHYSVEDSLINKISANFIGNHVVSAGNPVNNNVGAIGGAIFNHYRINEIESTFTNNYAKSDDTTSNDRASGGAIGNEGIIASDDASNREPITVYKYTVTDGSNTLTYYKTEDLNKMKNALTQNKKIYVLNADGTEETPPTYDTVKAALDAGDETTYLAKSPAILIGADAYWTPQNGGIKESTFSGNYVEASAAGAMAAGGAIYNTESGAIHFDGHQIFENNRATATGSANAYGAAIYNAGVISDLDAEFRGNVAEGAGYIYGGAIDNRGVMGNITGTFENNASNKNSAGDGESIGGAIHNMGLINSIDAEFENNTVYSMQGARGGAIRSHRGYIGYIGNIFEGNSAVAEGNVLGGAIALNETPVKTIEAIFKNNYAEANNGAWGGALSMEGEASIKDVISTFIGNHVVGKTSNFAYGGAIGMYSTDQSIENISSTFTGNYAQTKSGLARGGAIYAGTIDNINGTFTSNYAVSESGSAYGGAVFNFGTIKNIDGIFKGNYAKAKSYAHGGAIRNNAGTITSLAADFIENKVQAEDNNADGGAISNTGVIKNISGDFTYNTVIGKQIFENGSYIYTGGGAIYNNNSIGSINSDFSKNKAIALDEAAATGGAIYNLYSSSSIDSVKGTFNSNGVEGTSGKALGGAIYNEGTIDDIRAYFEENTAKSENSYAQGGAISLVDSNATIGTITGKFEGNSVTGKSDGAGNYTGGGAIYNAGTIDDIHADFVGNTATGTDDSKVYGGAIYNNGGTIKNITGKLKDNEVVPGENGYSYGGAIANIGSTANMTITDSVFDHNFAVMHGGSITNMQGNITIKNSKFVNNEAVKDVIYNYLGVINIYDSNFVNNNAERGVLYISEDSQNRIYAKDADTTFINNSGYDIKSTTAEYIGNAELTLNANIGRKISFGGIVQTLGTINIGTAVDDNTLDQTVKGGEVVFANTVTGNTVNLSSGTSVHLGSITLPSLTTPNTNETYYGQLNLNALNVSVNGGLISAINNVVSQGTTAQNLGAVTLNGDLKLGLDLDATNAIGDIFTASSVSQGSGASGKKILISQINLIGTYSDPIVVATDAYVGANMDVGSDLIISGSNLGNGLTTAAYEWSSTDGKGYLSLANDNTVNSLSAAVLDTTHASRAYVMRTNETIDKDHPLQYVDPNDETKIISLGGTSLSIDTKGYDVTGVSYVDPDTGETVNPSGIRVSDGQALSITGTDANGNRSTWSGFGDRVIANSGTIKDLEMDLSNNEGFAVIFSYDGNIGTIRGDFTNNTSIEGTIYNGGTTSASIGHIIGNFVNNTSLGQSGEHEAIGGAIFQWGTKSSIGDITGSFVNNRTVRTDDRGSLGGAIEISAGSIGSITGQNYTLTSGEDAGKTINGFYGNSATSAGGTAAGGAIFNRNGTVGDIDADFIKNKAESENAAAQGGAIWNSGTIGDITGTDFTVTLGTGASAQEKTIRGFYQNEAESGHLATALEKAYKHYAVNDINALYSALVADTNEDVQTYLSGKTQEAVIADLTTGTGLATLGYENGYVGDVALGGAIYNVGAIGDILVDFVENKASSLKETAAGAAIYNEGTIGDIGSAEKSSLFYGNEASGLHQNTHNIAGAAIYNYQGATIGNIYANFENNKVTRINEEDPVLIAKYSNGGAISNQGSIGDIVGNFTNNSAITNSSIEDRGHTGVYAGAIINWNSTGHIKSIKGDFTNNSASTQYGQAKGGAISNYTSAKIDYIDGDFTSNKIRSYDDFAAGGAIENRNSAQIGKIANSEFSNNKAESTNSTAYGGGISNVNAVIGTDENAASKLSRYYRYVVTYINGDTVETTTVYDKTAYDDIGAKVANGDVFIPSVYDSYIILDASVEGDTAKWNAYNDTTTSSAYTKTDPKSQMKAENWYVPEGEGLTNVAFVGNEAKGTSAYGGAIYNTGAIGKITGKEVEVEYTDTATNEVLTKKVNGFYGNKATGTGVGTTAIGAAIYNSGVINSIEADFEKNENTHYHGAGGTVYNNGGVIGAIIGDFIGNRSEVTEAEGHAAAISNRNYGTINSISGNFINNYTEANDGNVYGTIFHYLGTIGTIEGRFEGNEAVAKTASRGGAISIATMSGTHETKVGNIKADFINNKAIGDGYAEGGAISMKNWAGNMEISSISGNFTGNMASSSGGYAYGGAIDNYGNSTIGNIVDSSFTDNYVKGDSDSEGGAIYNRGTITISAENKDSKFSGNKVINVDENGSEIANRYHNSEFQNIEFYTYCSVIDNFYNY